MYGFIFFFFLHKHTINIIDLAQSEESDDSPIYLFNSDSNLHNNNSDVTMLYDLDTDIGIDTNGTACTAVTGSDTAASKAGPVEDNDSFSKIFEGVYD